MASDDASSTPTNASSDPSTSGESPEPTPTDDSNDEGEEAESNATPTSSNLGARPSDALTACVAGAAGVLGLAIVL